MPARNIMPVPRNISFPWPLPNKHGSSGISSLGMTYIKMMVDRFQLGGGLV